MVNAARLRPEETPVRKAAGIAASLCFALVYPAAPAVSAPSCPDVDAAQAMLLRAAAAKNDQDLKQMPRNVPPDALPQPGAKGQTAQPGQPGAPVKGKPGTQPQQGQPPQPGQPAQQEGAQPDKDKEAPPAVETAPVPEDLKRAALLVKQADDACQAGQAAEASEKAKAAMALMKR
jgi:hypothetical protein